MLWEKKTSKQLKDLKLNPEKFNSRGYLYLRESVYIRDRRTLQRKPRHLGDGSKQKERNKYIKKKDMYLGKINEISPDFYLSFENYIISHIQKDQDFLYYVLQYDFEEIFFDYIDYIQEIYTLPISISKDAIKYYGVKEEFTYLKSKTYELKTGGFFNIILIQRAFNFECRKNEEVSSSDFNNFSARCFDCGITDEYIQVVLYSKLIHVENVQELEEEIALLRMEKEQEESYEEESFEKFMRRMHKE